MDLGILPRRADRDRRARGVTTGTLAVADTLPHRADLPLGDRAGARNPSAARNLETVDPVVRGGASDAARRAPRRGRAARRERLRGRPPCGALAGRPDNRVRRHSRFRATALRAAARLARIEAALGHRGSAFPLLLSGRPVDRVLLCRHAQEGRGHRRRCGHDRPHHGRARRHLGTGRHDRVRAESHDWTLSRARWRRHARRDHEGGGERAHAPLAVVPAGRQRRPLRPAGITMRPSTTGSSKQCGSTRRSGRS
jgi:hypothetical protein